ncbi:HAMP domain-containing protein [Spirosoma sp. HMF3257]|uniref:histidine kinase n=1 Tax=Spirosoma telluris TaxID=2183553 RepID=A0A327NTF1_9BACT|nr:HAMP domain-containing protein [Spirosoma telluris]RAI77084.1 PAS domain-containing sensor histidine kinase [Spirosoma telluris]
MTLKTKVSLSLVFLFSIILVLGGLGAFYLNQLAQDSRAILKDNYISLEFVSNMQKALTTLDDPDALADFAANLKKQEANLTEVGEAQATSAVRREFTRLRAGATDIGTINRIRLHLFAIDDLNRQAIVRKSRTAEQTAKDALLWLGSIGTFCFLIVFSFVINIPNYIAGPLRELTRGIKQITSRNFEERLHFKSSDEFGELARSFNSMAQKLDEYEHSNLARVLFEKKRIDTLVEIMSEGIIGLDEKRRILFINPVAERLLGVERKLLIGKYAPDVATSNDLLRVLIQDIMPDSAELQTRSTIEPLRPETGSDLLKIYDPGLNGKGKESYFTKEIHAVEVTPTGETQTVQAGYVIMLLNITSYKELDLAKTNFIATVSHELKTPISAIKMSLKLLADKRLGVLNSEQQEMVNHVEENTDRLLRLTGELLNMAQVESGQIQLQIQATNPTELVRVATSALRTQAEQKQIQFKLAIPADLPAVKADPDKASWVLINFLSNAIRHSPEQSSIDITAQKLNDQVEFTVRDYGPGLREEHRERVFERYFKAPGLNGPFSGTGLGLSISKEFIQSMGGQIGLHPNVVPGAAFYFQLAIA